MDVRAISINDIGLSVRASNGLHRAGVDTVGEMLAQTWESLTAVRNLGKKSVDEILQKIEEYKAYAAEGGLPEPEEGGLVLREILDRFAVDLNAGQPEAYHVSMPPQYHVFWETKPAKRHRITVRITAWRGGESPV